MSFDKSLTYTKNNKGPKMDPCSAPQREYQPKTNKDHLKQIFTFCPLASPLKYINHSTTNTILMHYKNQFIIPFFVKSFGDVKEYPTNFKPHIKSI